jgi:hypothetical protein
MGWNIMNKKLLNITIDPTKLSRLNRYIIQDSFSSRIKEISKINLTVANNPSINNITLSDSYSSSSSKIQVVDSIKRIELDPKVGCEFSNKILFSGYDESKLQFNALEGIANIISHSLVTIANQEYYPISFITLYFYTRSENIVDNSNYIKYSRTPEEDSNIDYVKDRNKLILENAIENSIIFIDGPLIGGNLSTYTLDLIDKLHKINVIPIFFVKNSNSNLVIDNLDELSSNFNSDLHWSYNFLKQGERTNLFLYKDEVNPNNKKLFCYFKPFNQTSPQRIEFHPETFSKFKEYFDDIFDLIYYLMLVQGNKNNPQIRPISLAEMYAREIIKTVNLRSILKNTSLVSTMNQERFGG